MLWKQSITIFGRVLSFSVRVAGVRSHFMYGVGNRCKDGFVLFLDYDGDIPLDWVKDEIMFLQRSFGVGSCYIFKTKHGFHVMNFEKRKIDEIVSIMRATTCDQQYKDTPLLFSKKVWVLRFKRKNGERIEYLGRVPGNDLLECSRPHVRFATEYYGIPAKDLRGLSLDDEQELLFAQYPIPKEQL